MTRRRVGRLPARVVPCDTVAASAATLVSCSSPAQTTSARWYAAGLSVLSASTARELQLALNPVPSGSRQRKRRPLLRLTRSPLLGLSLSLQTLRHAARSSTLNALVTLELACS